MNNYAIIVAAGKGSRFDKNNLKQFYKINTIPILAKTISIFEKISFIHKIILVVNENYIDYVNKNIVKKYKFKKIESIVKGGNSRFFSVYNGLNSIKQTSYVFIHDGVRPFVKKSDIKNLYNCVKKNNSAVLGVKINDTIIKSKNNIIINSINRESIYRLQTPQAFKFDIIKNAYNKAIKLKNKNFTDDSSVVNKILKYKTYIVEGDPFNIKITTKDDIKNVKLKNICK